METIIGLAMFYSWIHLAFIQHTKAYIERTDYEKIVTWVAIGSLVLFIIGSLE